jgi:hypothetical protein
MPYWISKALLVSKVDILYTTSFENQGCTADAGGRLPSHSCH